MADYYQVRLYNPQRKFIRLIDDYSELTIGRKRNNIGSVTLRANPYMPTLEPNSILLIEQSINGNAMQMVGETIFFIKTITYDNDGITYTANDANYLLNWRIIAANSGTPQADKELRADNYIKALAREQFGELVNDYRRKWPIVIELDKSLAPVVKQESARDKLLNVYQTLCQASDEKGTPLFFDIVADYDLNLTLRTYVKQRGIDRSTLVLTHDQLLDLTLEIDDTDTPTVIYSGGNGKGENRNVQVVIGEDADKGTFAWREAWVADKDLSSSKALVDEGMAKLKASRTKITLTANIVSTPEFAFGRHFNFGDIVTAQGYGYNVPCAIDEFEIRISEGKAETTVSLEGIV